MAVVSSQLQGQLVTERVAFVALAYRQHLTLVDVQLVAEAPQLGQKLTGRLLPGRHHLDPNRWFARTGLGAVPDQGQEVLVAIGQGQQRRLIAEQTIAVR